MYVQNFLCIAQFQKSEEKKKNSITLKMQMEHWY